MPERNSLEELHVDELLAQALEPRSILLLRVGQAPRVQRGADRGAHDLSYEVCKPQHVQHMAYDIMSDGQIEKFEQDSKLAFAYRTRAMHTQHAQFLVVVVRERGDIGVMFLALSPGVPRPELP